jgi:hypothetical protein
MQMRTPIKQKPRPDAANIGSRAKNQIQHRHSTLVREIVGMALTAAIFTASVWASVFGAADDLASGPVIPMSYSMAEASDHE